MRSNNRL